MVRGHPARLVKLGLNQPSVQQQSSEQTPKHYPPGFRCLTDKVPKVQRYRMDQGRRYSPGRAGSGNTKWQFQAVSRAPGSETGVIMHQGQVFLETATHKLFFLTLPEDLRSRFSGGLSTRSNQRTADCQKPPRITPPSPFHTQGKRREQRGGETAVLKSRRWRTSARSCLLSPAPVPAGCSPVH